MFEDKLNKEIIYLVTKENKETVCKNCALYQSETFVYCHLCNTKFVSEAKKDIIEYITALKEDEFNELGTENSQLNSFFNERFNEIIRKVINL